MIEGRIFEDHPLLGLMAGTEPTKFVKARVNILPT